MNSIEKTTGHSPHVNVAKAATEPEAVIGRGEQVLERVHQVARQIEEQVRRLLNAPVDAVLFPSTDRKSSNPSQA